MTDHPILFSAPMICALLNGSKTQTRRLLKPQPACKYPVYRQTVNEGVSIGIEKEPNIQAGDRLWVRESWSTDARNDPLKPSLIAPTEPVWFSADGATHNVSALSLKSNKKRPSIFMPRWASRLTLKVKEVRLERLQNISAEDAIAEGVKKTGRFDEQVWKNYDKENSLGEGFLFPQNSYRTLWSSINGIRSWDANPWVIVYSFSVHMNNIDVLPCGQSQ